RIKDRQKWGHCYARSNTGVVHFLDCLKSSFVGRAQRLKRFSYFFTVRSNRHIDLDKIKLFEQIDVPCNQLTSRLYDDARLVVLIKLFQQTTSKAKITLDRLIRISYTTNVDRPINQRFLAKLHQQLKRILLDL